eukprot:13253724-Alexandrium_andersonii.AAC.1
MPERLPLWAMPSSSKAWATAIGRPQGAPSPDVSGSGAPKRLTARKMLRAVWRWRISMYVLALA